MRLLLVGNPNAGKSTLFNRLTRGHAHVGNWHGVTVRETEGEARLGKNRLTVVDLPGVYSAPGTSMEEKYALAYLGAHGEDAVAFVSEYASVGRILPLMAELTKGRRRAVLVLTKRRAFERAGGALDADALASRLGIPVLDADRRDLKEALFRAAAAPSVRVKRASLAGIARQPREGLSKWDDLLLTGAFGVPFFAALLLLVFLVTFARGFPGDAMKRGVEWLFGEYLAGFAAAVPSPLLGSFLSDGILKALGGVLSFLPQIALLYLFLILMEESGLLSRLAVLTDGFFARLGLNGRAAFSLLMGFGCTAAAILTTRSLDDARIQRRTILCLPYIACSAKLPVFLTVASSFFSDPFPAVAALYALGLLFAVLAALILREGERPPFVMELAPMQLPRPLFVAKSLLFQIKQFIIKVSTVVLAFFLLSWMLSSFDFSFRLCGAEESMLATLCGGLGFLFAPAGMADWRIAYAALAGLVAKENVAGAIAMFFGEFPYSFASGFAFSVFLLTCSPCVSAIATSARELGKGRALRYAAFQTVSALLLCYLAYFVLRGGWAILLPAAIPAACCFFLFRHEKLFRRKTDDAQSVHGRDRRTGVVRVPKALKGARDPRERRARRFGRPARGGR